MINADRLAQALVWAEERYANCDVCAVGCGVNRLTGEVGQCGLGEEGLVYKEYVHLGEERCLVPSHTIYLSGCNFRCAFCSDLAPVLKPLSHGVSVQPEVLAKRIAKRRAEGALNVNFVGGLPDVNLLYILRTLSHCPGDTHVVWNTNLWTTSEAVEVLRGIVNTWLVDLKFGQDTCARKLAGARNYLETIHTLLPQVDKAGALIVRHLLMPGHIECCTKPALLWLSRHLPDASVNIMTGYHPFQLAGRRGALGGALSSEEKNAGVALASELFPSRLLVDGVPWGEA